MPWLKASVAAVGTCTFRPKVTHSDIEAVISPLLASDVNIIPIRLVLLSYLRGLVVCDLNYLPKLVLHHRLEDLPAVLFAFKECFAELNELVWAYVAGQGWPLGSITA